MRIVQTELTEPEHALLTSYARGKGKTIKEVVRDLVREFVLSDRVHSGDPVFSEPPVGARRGVKDVTSVEHDRVLYGGEK